MFRCGSLKRHGALLAVALLCGAVSPVIGAEHVLELIPEDALGFAIAKSVDTVDAKVGAFAKGAGMPIPPFAKTAGEFFKIDEGGRRAQPGRRRGYRREDGKETGRHAPPSDDRPGSVDGELGAGEAGRRPVERASRPDAFALRGKGTVMPFSVISAKRKP